MDPQSGDDRRRSVFTTIDGTKLQATVELELRDGLSSEELDLLGRSGARLEGIGARTVSFVLDSLDATGGHQELGYPTARMYAEVRLGKAPATARERLAIGRALRELPALHQAFAEERLCWSQVRAIARVATPETESEWVEWAAGRTARQTVAHTRSREKGQRPTDPQRRHVHTTTFKVECVFNVVQMELWNNARAKLEASRGRPLSNAEALLEAATLIVNRTPDGSVPGWRPVSDEPFKVVVRHDPETGETAAHTADGLVPLAPDIAREILSEAGREDLAEAVPDTVPGPVPGIVPGSGPEAIREPSDRAAATAPAAPAAPATHNGTRPSTDPPPIVPPSERDRPTPRALRRAVLARDGLRCRHCGSKHRLSADHIRERRRRGPTVEANLETLDEPCHSLKTDGLIRVEGTPETGLRFFDRNGRDLHAPGAPTGLEMIPAPLEAGRSIGGSSLLTLNDLPGECDTEWWARHGHLLKWNERRGVLEFTPGVARPDGRAARAAEPVDDASRAGAARATITLDDARAARPARLAEFIGQKRVFESLEFAVRAARELGDPMPHLLLQGPGGVGKTSLARAVANELGGGFHALAAPLVAEFGTLLRRLASLRRDGEVVFIDEIHRLPLRIAEALYEAMDDGKLNVSVACGHEERALHVHLPRFSLIAATTEEELLPAPLRSRFGLSERLEFYARDEIAELLRQAAARAGLGMRPDASRLLARAARDTPREALGLFRCVRDQARLDSRSTIDRRTVRRVLERLDIDERGLRPLERRCLEILEGGPLGSRTLAGRLGVAVRKLVEAVEPYLVRHGYLTITPWGRALAGAPA